MGWWNLKKEPKGPGLGLKFMVGEQLPWKGIVFSVKKVEHDEIVLIPMGLTWQMSKKIRKAKNG